MKNSDIYFSRSVLYAPKVLSVDSDDSEEAKPLATENDKENIGEPEEPEVVNKHIPEEDLSQPLMPWRAQLRKTNSTLNLLE